MRRRLICLLTASTLAIAGLVIAAAPATASTTLTYVPAGHALRPGQVLVSPHGTYHAGIGALSGRLIIANRRGTRTWSTRPTRRGAHLLVGARGNVRILAGSRTYWQTATTGSGAHDVLRLRDDGVLALKSGRALAWSSNLGNGCRGSRGKTFVADLSRQLAWLCYGANVQRTTYITSGATARGNGTPRGTWRVQHRVRNTTLYPASGGAYPVHYWVPYDGAYGLHDSPWQHFRYGSSLYRTLGSHGCIHVPGTTMAWFFSWARVGTTTVRIHG